MFREQLMTALKSAVGHYNAGATDVDAVVKAAQAADFNPDQAQRLVETYNTAKTLSMFKTAADRTQSFSTADPEKVMRSLFDGKAMKEARASEIKAAGAPYAFDYSEYDSPERLDEMEKAAQDEAYGIELTARATPSLDSLARAAYHAIDEVKASADKCASDAAEIREHYRWMLGKLASAFVQDLGDGHRLEQGLAWIKSAHPSNADAVIADLRAFLPASHAEKQAADVRLSTFDMDHADIAAMLDSAVEAKQASAELLACEATFRAMADEWRDEFHKAAGLVRDDTAEDEEVAGLFDPGFLDKVAKTSYETVSTWDALTGADDPRKIKVENTGLVEDIFGLGKDTVGKTVADEMTRILPKAITGEATREQEKYRDRIRNFQRQVMLEELLSTDPILAGVDPNSALRSYDALVRIAPEYSLNKEVVRSILRTTTNAEAISPYDAKQLAELENITRKTLSLRKPSPGARVNINV